MEIMCLLFAKENLHLFFIKMVHKYRLCCFLHEVPQICWQMYPDLACWRPSEQPDGNMLYCSYNTQKHNDMKKEYPHGCVQLLDLKHPGRMFGCRAQLCRFSVKGVSRNGDLCGANTLVFVCSTPTEKFVEHQGRNLVQSKCDIADTWKRKVSNPEKAEQKGWRETTSNSLLWGLQLWPLLGVHCFNPLL